MLIGFRKSASGEFFAKVEIFRLEANFWRCAIRRNVTSIATTRDCTLTLRGIYSWGKVGNAFSVNAA